MLSYLDEYYILLLLVIFGPFGWLKSQRCLAGSACVDVLLGLLLLVWCVAGLPPACVVCLCGVLLGPIRQPRLVLSAAEQAETPWRTVWLELYISGQMELSFAEHVDSGMLLFC